MEKIYTVTLYDRDRYGLGVSQIICKTLEVAREKAKEMFYERVTNNGIDLLSDENSVIEEDNCYSVDNRYSELSVYVNEIEFNEEKEIVDAN